MIQMQTSLAVADNSGAKRVEMIMPVGGSGNYKLMNQSSAPLVLGNPQGATVAGTQPQMEADTGPMPSQQWTFIP